MAIFDEEKQKLKIEHLRQKEEEEVTNLLSKKYGIPYADLSEMTIDLDYLKLIPEQDSRKGKIAVFQGIGKKIQVAEQNPTLETAKIWIKKLSEDYEIQPFLVSNKSLEKAWSRYKEVPAFVELSKGIIDISPERIEEFLSQAYSLENLKAAFLQKTATGENRKISELLEILMAGAFGTDASDIHIEPEENEVKIRFRIDGVLHDVLEFDQRAYKLLLSRIKLISEMKLNIKEKAQDGRFSVKIKNEEIEIRTSALPGPYGESLVLRILNPKSINVNFAELGMDPSLQEIIKTQIKKPNGMILTTGPTGSGKTTTLYAFLKEIQSPEIKIITLEEPIEYHLEGITQTQTNSEKGYDFSSGLRSILRQDPDVIMVGEIRDLEAAEIALNAALTGHLVFSTIHTNDAAGTIPRLIELGANPNIIAPAVNLAIAQRLVRKLCPYCKKEYKPKEEELAILSKIMEGLPKKIEKIDIKKAKLYQASGCEKCGGIGYKGRIGIFEGILIDDEMEKLVMKNPSETEIREASVRQEMLVMKQDATLKILKGETSFDEVRRVVDME
ncbi:MAG: ATPase, T2SS/T4P/T4SS family [Candidatus Pacebacteria bacterium]|nr:ATPase, T2SS/T4P/T4SS family [Candidatus Paceibacterota bacterium]